MKNKLLLASMVLSFTLNAQTPAAYWTLTGNSGTTPGTNFIGTTDNVSLMFQVNGTLSGQITSGTNMSFGYQSLISNTTVINNTAVGNRALFSTTTGFRNIGLGTQAGEGITSGTEDISIGYQSMQPDYNNVTGSRNVAVGNHSMFGNSASPSAHSGNDNTAVGHVALGGEIDGSFNTAIGSGSFRNHTNGNNNTAVGFNTLYNNLTGSGNTALGHISLTNCTGSGNIAIGDSAGYNATGDNKLYIGKNGYIVGDMSANTLAITPVTTVTLAAVSVNTSQTTVNASSGDIVCSQPVIGTTWKKVVINLRASNGTATYTFPVPFNEIPGIFPSSSVLATDVSALSTTSITISTLTKTGVLILEGY